MRSLLVTFLAGLLVFSAHAQTGNRRPAKPKPNPTPVKKLNEQAEWDKATALTDAAERITALKKFVERFPKSTKLAEAGTLLVKAEAGLGAEKLVGGDIDAGADFFKAAAADAPKPVPDELWADLLSKFAANLYFRGARGEALDVAKILENKADTNAGQLLNIAGFYLSVENGSEAKRVAEAAIKLDPNSSAAYQTLGLASRMEFQLEDSAAAFAKALELEPESLTARRGLAEMKRSLGKADEAAVLYREILAKDEGNVPARTGLILALFDAGSRSDAEAEMAKSLEANPGNVILLAGAAYWYAASGEGDKAIESAKKAIAADPRFIWSHIALGRGFLAQNKPIEAEKTLLAARRYGNFPTLEYEIASARLAAGLYREAAEELARSFTVKDGVIHANLGGRVPRDSKYFTELVGFERRASIFAPTAADNPENAAQLRALVELKQTLDAAKPNADAAARAADEFVRGDDKMKVHRQLFAATQLLDKKTALPKVLEIVKAAPQNLDAGLDVSDASTAVLASELYESRAIAAARGDYVGVPAVPRSTLSSVMRGRIEEITGWTYYQMDDSAQAAVHLRRAAGVLPADSAYWKSSLWRLGTALVVNGKDAEALDAYIKSYKAGTPDALRYNAIEAVYKRVNGTADGLDAKIGPNPAPPVSAGLVAQKTEPSPAPDIPAAVPAAVEPSPTVEPTTPTPELVKEEPKPVDLPAVVATPTPTVEKPKIVPSPAPEEIKPTPTPELSPTPTPVIEFASPAYVPGVVPIATPTPTVEEPTVVPSPASEEIKPTPTPELSPSPAPEVSPTPTPDASPTPTPDQTPEPQKTPDDLAVAESKPVNPTNDLFPPVIIMIPAPETPKPTIKPEPSPSPAGSVTTEEPKPTPTPEAAAITAQEEIRPTPTPTPEQNSGDPAPLDARPRFVEEKPETKAVRPCWLTVSEESLTLQTGGGGMAVIVGRSDGNELDGLTAVSTSPANVSVRRQVIEGMRTRELFVLHPVGTKPGVYQVRFEMPCGKREIVVRVR